MPVSGEPSPVEAPDTAGVPDSGEIPSFAEASQAAGMPGSERPSLAQAIDLVFECLDQGADRPWWLQTLMLHSDESIPSEVAAIGIDTNILKVLRRAPLMADNLLTFIEDRGIPLIIPGQSAQEYWNNHGAIVRDIDGVYKTLEDLKRKIANISLSEQQKSAVHAIETNIERLSLEMHDSRRPELLRESTEFWKSVLPKAVSCNVPRSSFKALAEVRFAAKTAPGFADTKKATQSLGDFFVWADFLLSLLLAGLGSPTDHPQRIIFVTDDDKPDWKASGKPHPVLMGELKQLTGRHLQIMGTKDFESTISPR